MAKPSFAVIRSDNLYWTVDGHPYNVHSRHQVPDDDPDYLAWAATHEPLATFANDVRTSLREEKAPPFQPITALQARRAMRSAGLYTDISNAVAAAVDPEIQDYWNFAAQWNRDDAWVATIAATLAYTEEQVDDLFVLAASL
jgi:hypothetical protein